jgi:hypothetical protein
MFSDVAGLGGMPGGGQIPQEAADDGKMMDLTPRIDTAKCYARNEAAGFPMSNLFIGDTRLGCKSDADEQLIVYVEFHEFVKVRGFGSMLVHQSLLSPGSSRFEGSLDKNYGV